MKVWNIIKTSGIAFLLGASAYSTYALIKDAQNYKSKTDLQKEIMQKDPKRYNAILKRPAIARPFHYKEWEYETKIMNDSLKVDSIVKKAYFEGAQMVRDSIARIR